MNSRVRRQAVPAAADLWAPDAGTMAIWNQLQPGTEVIIVKRDLDGVEAARYPGTVTVFPGDTIDGPWRTLVATWTMHDVAQGDLTFVTGDTLYERFSWEHPFNAFGVESSSGMFRGWYANVTWPTFLEETPDGLVLTWQDLVLDLIVLPGGRLIYLDEDELEDSPITQDDPDLAQTIVSIRDHLAGLARRNIPPFTR